MYSNEADDPVQSWPPCKITAYGETFLDAASLIDPTLSELPLTSEGSVITFDLEYSLHVEIGLKSCKKLESFLLCPFFSSPAISGKIQ